MHDIGVPLIGFPGRERLNGKNSQLNRMKAEALSPSKTVSSKDVTCPSVENIQGPEGQKQCRKSKQNVSIWDLGDQISCPSVVERTGAQS